ncbi:MAG: outer membrane lipoprotein carrier protein LolA [Bacteroidota bacterium]|nr:outer membrane lipoprotein carrier protein LolA [Bacteroidota bacterium]MDP3144320.1 outer membrane lipoprotein carrier protein LolA [Bacteroidota bacterium]MDP3556306.1 outer membrane lipoprotein carrier protein LolA [Bacteroidota bacterium]
MKKLLGLLFVCGSIILSAQDQDPKAKAILDDLSKTTKAYKTITADYSFTILNKEKKQVEKQAGKVQIKGNKFKLEIPGNTIVCDGKTLWNYSKDAKEVTIKDFDVDNDDQLNPSKIFTIYETGYKFKYDKEEKVGVAMCHVIDLYPSVKPEKKKFHTAKIYVDKVKKQVTKLVMIMKDGGQNVYDIKTLKPNLEIADIVFVFDTKGLKPDQISDER